MASNDMLGKKLPEEFKQKWVAALRSGKYKQGRRRLYTIEDNSFCCLGVAATICSTIPTSSFGRGTIPEKVYQEDFKEDWGVPIELSDSSTLQTLLWKMNDEDGLTFSQIADYIEKEL